MGRVPEYDIWYHFGDTFNDVILDYEDGDGDPVDLTGWEVALYVASAAGGVPVVSLDNSKFTISIPPGGAVANRITPNASPADMAALTPGTYFYDWQIKDTAPDPDIVETLLRGMFHVDAQVTNA